MNDLSHASQPDAHSPDMLGRRLCAAFLQHLAHPFADHAADAQTSRTRPALAPDDVPEDDEGDTLCGGPDTGRDTGPDLSAELEAPEQEQDPAHFCLQRRESRAAAMSPGEIAAALAAGDDPFAQAADGADAPPRLHKPVVMALAGLLALARHVNSPEGLRNLLEPGALVLLRVRSTGQGQALAKALNEAVLQQLCADAGLEPKPVVLTCLGKDDDKPSDISARQRALQAKIEEALQRRDRAVLVIAETPAALGETFRLLCEQTFNLARLDGAMLIEILRLTHSATDALAEDAIRAALPPDPALARLDGVLLEAAAAETGPLRVARRLARFAASAQPAASITLADVHGQPAALTALGRMQRDLDLWQAGRLAWQDVTRSAVLYGPPGNGKTMLALALAGSAGLPLVATSYADCQRAGHQGDMLRELHVAFSAAISRAPSVLFIDEIDSFSARGREAKHDAYMRGVVNGLLTQLSRAAESEGVVVLAATNFLDVVDPAVIRSGRFDLKIPVLAPDRKGVEAILRAPLDRRGETGALAEAEIDDLTDRLLGASGADIVAMMRQAAAIARDRSGQDGGAQDGVAQGGGDQDAPDTTVTAADLRAAADLMLPRADPEDLHRVAVHEAGHLVVGAVLGLPPPLGAQLTARGGMVTRKNLPFMTPDTARAQLAALMGGRAAEVALLGAPSSGSGAGEDSDLALAGTLAARIEAQWSLGSGCLLWHPETALLPPLMPAGLTARVTALLEAAAAEAEQIVATHLEALEHIAATLLKRRELSAEDLADLLRGIGPA